MYGVTAMMLLEHPHYYKEHNKRDLQISSEDPTFQIWSTPAPAPAPATKSEDQLTKSRGRSKAELMRNNERIASLLLHDHDNTNAKIDQGLTPYWFVEGVHLHDEPTPLAST